MEGVGHGALCAGAYPPCRDVAIVVHVRVVDEDEEEGERKSQREADAPPRALSFPLLHP